MVIQTKTKKHRQQLSPNNTMYIRIGSVCCGVKCIDDEVLYILRTLYEDFLTEGPADINVELNTPTMLNPVELETVLEDTRFIHANNTFRTTSLVMSGSYDLVNGEISISGDRNLCNPDLELNHLNRLIALMYHSACKIKHGTPPAYLVHSCAIKREGRVLIFAGPCETGKTTVAKFCGDRYGQVLNDEMVLVSSTPQQDGRLSVEAAPILGGFPQHVKTTAPLGCIFLLKQSEKTAVRKLERTESFLRFMRQVVTPAYIGQRSKREIHSLIAEFSDIVTGTTPFYELEFTLNKEAFWQAVEEVERKLEKKETINE